MLEIQIQKDAKPQTVLKVHFRSANDEAAIKSQLKVGADGKLKIDVSSIWNYGYSLDQGIWWRTCEKRYDDPTSQTGKKREHTMQIMIPSSVIQLVEVDVV